MIFYSSFNPVNANEGKGEGKKKTEVSVNIMKLI